MNHAEARILELETRVAELTKLVEHLRPTADPLSVRALDAAVPRVATPRGAVADDESPTSSRRGMLKLAGSAAVGAGVMAVAGRATPAAAANGDALVIGADNSGTDTTQLIGKLDVISDSSTHPLLVSGYSGAIFGAEATDASDVRRAGVVGYSGAFLTQAGTRGHGVLGVARSVSATGSGVYGISESNIVGRSAGVRATSASGPAIQLEAALAGPPTTGEWTAGAILPDTAGNLWYCTATGTPGTWRKLAGTSTAGSFHPVSPGRVYDSRADAPSPGQLQGGANRTISVSDRRDTTTGASVQANFVPPGATAVSANVTVTDTVGAGFLAINPGGTTTVNASAINWSGDGQNLANGLSLTLNGQREVTVIIGGGGSTNFIIDILGYYL